MSLTVYPAALDEFPARVDGVDQTIFAQHMNFVQDAISAIESTLGINPQGSEATVSARIAALEGFESVITTKGDLVVGDVNGQPSRLAVGADGKVPVADSGAPGGISWQDVPAPTEPNPTLPTLDTAFPLVDNYVADMAIIGDTLYIAGGFTSVGGTPRNGLAAFDIPTKTLLPWDPAADIAASNGILQVGANLLISGFFTNIGGAARTRIALIDPITGLDAGTDFALSGGSAVVNSLAPSAGGGAYICGDFTSILGEARTNLAKIDSSYVVQAFDASATVSGFNVLAAAEGTFNLLVGTQHPNGAQAPIFSLNKISGNLVAQTQWGVSGRVLFDGTDFWFDTQGMMLKASEDLSSIDVMAYSIPAKALLYENGRLWMFTPGYGFRGGQQGRHRFGIAIIDGGDGETQDIAVNVSASAIHKVIQSGGTTFVCGSFLMVGTEERLNLFSFPNFA